MYKVLLERNVVIFISKLQKSTKAKYERLRDLLIQRGPDLGMPHSKIIRSKLFELRIRGVQEVRLFCVPKGQEIYVFHGFVKKTNRIPIKELGTILNKFDNLK